MPSMVRVSQDKNLNSNYQLNSHLLDSFVSQPTGAMSCHFCIMKNSGCAGCERNQLNHTGHIPLHYGLGSPITLSKNFLHEFILQLSTSLLADNNPSNPKIEESLKEGTLSKYCQCHLNTTIQSVTAKLSQTLGLQILQEVEKALEDEELTKENARKAAEKVFEEAVLAKAKVVAQEIAKTTAEEIMKVATASSTPRPVPETPRSTPAAPKKNIDQAAAVEIAKAQEAIVSAKSPSELQPLITF